MKWSAIYGSFKFDDKKIRFVGKPTPYRLPGGEQRKGLANGLAMSSQTFANGNLAATVEFGKVGAGASCELIIYYDPLGRAQVGAGIGSTVGGYVIRHWDPETGWKVHASAGEQGAIVPKRKYELRVAVRGSRVGLSVDGVEVLATVLPFQLPPSQVGVCCFNDADLTISNYRSDGRAGRVFVVMQFGTPFDSIHEEVIKKVCDEFELEGRRVDETYGPGLIVADIANQIAESEFVIAEITPPNPNVYYELGYAYGIRKPVILLAERSLAKLPFDVSGFRVLFYENSIGGKRKFEEGLRQHIAAILQRPVSRSS